MGTLEPMTTGMTWIIRWLGYDREGHGSCNNGYPGGDTTRSDTKWEENGRTRITKKGLTPGMCMIGYGILWVIISAQERQAATMVFNTACWGGWFGWACFSDRNAIDNTYELP